MATYQKRYLFFFQVQYLSELNKTIWFVQFWRSLTNKGDSETAGAAGESCEHVTTNFQVQVDYVVLVEEGDSLQYLLHEPLHVLFSEGLILPIWHTLVEDLASSRTAQDTAGRNTNCQSSARLSLVKASIYRKCKVRGATAGYHSWIQTQTNTFACNLEFPVDLMCMCLDSGRKPGHPQETQTALPVPCFTHNLIKMMSGFYCESHRTP